MFNRISAVMAVAAVLGATAAAHHGVRSAAAQAAEKPYVIEYYYKVKWGYQDEFLALYKKNHYPVMKKEMEMGRIIGLTMVKPRYHATEDGRWDYRMTITWKSASVAQDGFDETTITKALYPDQDAFRKDEARRFAILDAHWDLPIGDVDLAK